jgi:hypothetical protein
MYVGWHYNYRGVAKVTASRQAKTEKARNVSKICFQVDRDVLLASLAEADGAGVSESPPVLWALQRGMRLVSPGFHLQRFEKHSWVENPKVG